MVRAISGLADADAARQPSWHCATLPSSRLTVRGSPSFRRPHGEERPAGSSRFSSPEDPLTAICTLPDGGGLSGGTWGLDDTIVFGTVGPRGGGLWRVAASGGKPDQLTVTEQGGHLWPKFLPGEQALVFTIFPQAGRNSLGAQVAVLNLTTKMQTVVAAGSDVKYSKTGHLIYAAGGALLAMGFDPGRLVATTSPVPVVDGVIVKNHGRSRLRSVRRWDAAVCLGLFHRRPPITLLVDRQGREEPIGMTPGPYIYARLSPDNTRVALDHRNGQDISIYSLNRTSMDVLTAADRGPNRLPVWSYDSSRLAFTSTRDGVESIYWQLADGSRPAERLSPASAASAGPMSFTPDDRALLFQSPLDAEPRRLALLRLGDHQEESLVLDGLKGRNGVISPDGHWIAYQSAETGREEVYLRPFPKAECEPTNRIDSGWHAATVVSKGRRVVLLRRARDDHECADYRRGDGSGPSTQRSCCCGSR